MTRPLEKILYIEDDPDIQAVARLALEQLGGFVVELCDSGHAALERFAEFRPDMVLLDVMMPGMDGPTTLRALRALPGGELTPVVIMTAKVQPQEIAQYRQLGALDVIPKPFDPLALAERVRAIWESRDAV